MIRPAYLDLVLQLINRGLPFLSFRPSALPPFNPHAKTQRRNNIFLLLLYSFTPLLLLPSVFIY